MLHTNTVMMINDYIIGLNGVTESLSFYIIDGIIQSGGTATTSTKIEYIEPSSAFEGARLLKHINFTENDYILVGHKCHMTLHDDGDQFLATSLFVHESQRHKGYAKRFLEQKFCAEKPIVIDTWVEGLKDTIRANPTLKVFGEV